MMPTLIKDFQWSESGEWVFIVLEIKGVKAGSSDVISSPNYLKVHCPPYIFEAFLLYEVDDTQGECTIDENSGKVSFRLKKTAPGLHWEQLENKELTKDEKSVKRAEAIQITHQRHDEEKTERQKRRFDRKQATVHDQIRLDSEAKERISKIKSFESEKALNELNEWASSTIPPASQAARTSNSNTSRNYELSPKEVDHNSRSIISATAQQQSAADDSTGRRFTECNTTDQEFTLSSKGTFQKDAAQLEHDNGSRNDSVEKELWRQCNDRIWTEKEVNELQGNVEGSQQHHQGGGGDGHHHQPHYIDHENHRSNLCSSQIRGEERANTTSSSRKVILPQEKEGFNSEGNPVSSLSAARMSSSMERKEESESEGNICSTGLRPQVADQEPTRASNHHYDNSRSCDETRKSGNNNDMTLSSQGAMNLAKNEREAVGIRPTVCISVNFTQRQFTTPSRESTQVEEQEWLKKQVEARRLSGFVDEDLRPEERNPQWLLDKGLSLMRTESYLGAISAFSLGIRLAPKMPELYVERARAHLAVKNYHRTVEDCSQASELLTPKVKANEEDRLKCHISRGAAFRELEMWEEALADYKEAIRLKPKNNEELSLARDEIQLALQTDLNKAQE